MKRRTALRERRGAAAVEFAIILPLLILIVFGIIEFGLLLFNGHMITHASREGARAGIVARNPSVKFQTGDPVDVRAVVNNWLANNLVTFGDANAAQVAVEICDKSTDSSCSSDSCFFEYDDPIFDPDTGTGDPCREFECPLRVTVTYNYEFLVLSIFGFGPKTFVATTLMKME